MGQPFIGEIRMFAGSFAPAGWAFCDGQLLPISENDALFTLIGTIYGGDGQETFALPNLQSRLPLHQGTGPSGTSYIIGEASGAEEVTLTVQQIPVHSHAPLASSSPGNSGTPANSVWAKPAAVTMYQAGVVPDASMSVQAVLPAGGSQPHENMMPFLVVSFIISLFGLFPRRT
jgi:microcystin-dependent protein